MDLSPPRHADERSVPGIGRGHPAAARILRRWRALSGGSGVVDANRRTVVACSGGADSMGLAIALSLVSHPPVIAYIAHDIRDEQTVGKELKTVEQLSERLGCVFDSRAVRVLGRDGNLEENARDARYAALCDIAADHGCAFIATGHHADDQAETVLMNLLRGSGVRGLGGIPESRELQTATLLRPLLGIRRDELVQLCADACVQTVHDETNDDLGFLRNRVRHALMPMLEEIRNDAVERIVAGATNCRRASRVIDRLVDDEYTRWERHGDEIVCERSRARGLSAVLLDGVVRRYIHDVHSGIGLDRVNQRSMDSFVAGVQSSSTDPGAFRIGPILAEITAHTITLCVANGERSES